VWDQKKILPVCAYLDGEYGVKGLYVGVPVKLGSSGIEEVLEWELSTNERAELQKSIDAVKENWEKMVVRL